MAETCAKCRQKLESTKGKLHSIDGRPVCNICLFKAKTEMFEEKVVGITKKAQAGLAKAKEVLVNNGD